VSNKSYSLKKVLLCTLAEIELFGWVSSKDAQLEMKQSTADRVKMHIDHPKSMETKLRRQELIDTAKAKGIDLFDSKFEQEVNEVIEWAKNLQLQDSRSTSFAKFVAEPYDNVIRGIAYEGSVTSRKFGFACSMLQSYRLAQKRQNQAGSNFIGVVGDIISGTANVINIKAMVCTDTKKTYRRSQSIQRKTWLVILSTNENNVIKWWANSQPTFNVGDRVSFAGKIKKHDDFKGYKSTVINYAKIKKV